MMFRLCSKGRDVRPGFGAAFAVDEWVSGFFSSIFFFVRLRNKKSSGQSAWGRSYRQHKKEVI